MALKAKTNQPTNNKKNLYCNLRITGRHISWAQWSFLATKFFCPLYKKSSNRNTHPQRKGRGVCSLPYRLLAHGFHFGRFKHSKGYIVWDLLCKSFCGRSSQYNLTFIMMRKGGTINNILHFLKLEKSREVKCTGSDEPESDCELCHF